MQSILNFRRTIPALLVAALMALFTACSVESTPDGSGGEGGDRGDESAASTSDSASSGAPVTCDEGATRCADVETVETCAADTWTPSACADVCGEIGFESTGCGPDDCACGEPLSDQCAQGAGAFCACAEGGGVPCSEDDAFALYTDCFQNGETAASTLCYGSFISGDSVDCQGAADNCPQ